MEEDWVKDTQTKQEVFDLWSNYADRGEAPHISDVAETLFGFTVPWFWNDHFIPVLNKIGKGQGKHLVAREVSRGHAKTSIAHLMVLYAGSFIIPHLPQARAVNKQILVIGRDETHTKDLMDELHQTICEFAPWLKYDEWSLMGDSWEDIYNQGIKGGGRKWNTTRMDLTNGVKIRGFAISQSVRRYHCFMAVIDDLVTDENFMEGEYHMVRIEGSILKAIEYTGLVLMLGTPQDDQDAYAMAAKEPKWDHLSLPGKDDSYVERNKRAIETGELPPRVDGEPYSTDDLRCLWPWRMNAREHRWEYGKTRQTNLIYDREIMLQRVSMADALVDANDVMAAKDPTLYYVNSAEDDEGVNQHAGGVDPSALSRSDAAICIGCQDENGVLVLRHWTVMDAQGENRSKDSTLHVCQKINDVSIAFRNPLLQIEQNQFQEMLAPVSKVLLNPGVNIQVKHLGGDKHTEVGWVGIRTLFANGKVRLPYGPTPAEAKLIAAGHLHPKDIEAIRITDKFISQLQRIRRAHGKVVTPKGVKDDMVSAFYQFTKAADDVFLQGGGAAVGGLSRVSDQGEMERPPASPHPEHTRNRQNLPSSLDRVAKAQRMAGLRGRFM